MKSKVLFFSLVVLLVISLIKANAPYEILDNDFDIEVVYVGMEKGVSDVLTYEEDEFDEDENEVKGNIVLNIIYRNYTYDLDKCNSNVQSAIDIWNVLVLEDKVLVKNELENVVENLIISEWNNKGYSNKLDVVELNISCDDVDYTIVSSSYEKREGKMTMTVILPGIPVEE